MIVSLMFPIVTLIISGTNIGIVVWWAIDCESIDGRREHGGVYDLCHADSD